MGERNNIIVFVVSERDLVPSLRTRCTKVRHHAQGHRIRRDWRQHHPSLSGIANFIFLLYPFFKILHLGIFVIYFSWSTILELGFHILRTIKS